MAARAREANADFKINPVPNLTGVFGQIRKQHEVLSDSDEDGSIIDEDDVMEQNQNNDSASIDDEDEESS